jgi:hypothetical protein
MGKKTAPIAEYGDFQTPANLAQIVCALLARDGLKPKALLEPTCGRGSLLFAGANQFACIEQIIGADVNAEHIKCARAILDHRDDSARFTLTEADFFATDWARVVASLPEPILLLGNPPWVTSAHLGTMRSQNVPVKSNFQEHTGLAAKTGKANFDISEWMLLRLLEALHGRRATLAMLCKSAVARKVLHYAWKNGIGLARSAVHRIDADLHFDVAVDAVLLVAHIRPGTSNLEASVYPDLDDETTEAIIGCENGILLANLTAYRRWAHLYGESGPKWRSGIKHDCSKVMELRREGSQFRNGFDELIDLEDTYLFPMLKSSDVAKGGAASGHRWMIVPQRAVNEDTTRIQENAPETWRYLKAHADLLARRGSSIYRGRPAFSVFGVGDYSFAPWKVAISGFYKKLAFTAIGPLGDKPAVFDDTSYFLPFQTQQQAEFIASMLNSDTAKEFFGAYVFWDSKRPITVELLRRMNLVHLATELGLSEEYKVLFGEAAKAPKRLGHSKQKQLRLW